MARRGPNGRFARDDDGPADDLAGLPPLVALTFEPTVEPSSGDVPPLPPAPADAPAESEFADAVDEPLGRVLAGGVNELVGVVFGAELRASDEEVAAVGEAAEPVVRRVLVLVHAGEMAESRVPVWMREVSVLAARAWVAWGDVGVILFEQTRERVSELRARREVEGAEAGPARAGVGGVRAPDRTNGPDAHGAGPAPAGAAAGQATGADRPGRGGPESVSRLLELDARSRRRGPDRS